MSVISWASLGAGIGFVLGFPLGAILMGKIEKSLLGGDE